MIRVILELFRIMAIFLIFGAVLGGLVKLIYASIGINIDNTIGGWLVGPAIITSLFVLYRNKLQFSGWYKGEGREKLPKIVSRMLIFGSISLLILAPLVSFYFNSISAL